MSEGKQRRFFSHICQMAVRPQKLFDQARALESLHSALYEWTIDSDELTWSPNAATVLDLPARAIPATGRAFAAMFEPGGGLGRADAIAADAVVSHPRGMPYHLRYAMRLDDDRVVTIIDNGRWFADRHGRPVTARGSVTLDARTTYDAMPAHMTQRSAFLRDLGASAKTRTSLADIAILVMAVDSGREVTPATGLQDYAHDGDILHEVINRLRGIMRHQDRFLVQPNGTIALALTACRQTELQQAIERLRENLESRQIQTADGDVAVQVRIGASCAPQHGTSASILLHHAEEALRDAIASGVSHAIFSSMSHARIQWEKSLASYLDNIELLTGEALAGHVTLSLRPLVDSHSRLPSLALARAGRRTDDLQVQPAHDLYLTAKEAGQTTLIDRHVFDLACEQLTGSTLDALIVPIAMESAADPEWLMFPAERLGAQPHVASRLIIGVPERFAACHPDLLDRRLHAMKALGIGVAIIDYGNGFIPCDALRNLPVDMVAINGALIQNIAFSTENRFYMRGLIDSIQRLDIVSAALWVEDERTASLLTDWGVNYLEGRVRTTSAKRNMVSKKIA